MKTAPMTIVALVFVISAASACQTLTGRSTGQFYDDKKVTTTVKAHLVKDKVANMTRIGVNTTNGVVYLNGVVDTAEDKARAEQIASQISGVKQVQNDLHVGTPAASPR
jgi:hyperosmotically inducible protein